MPCGKWEGEGEGKGEGEGEGEGEVEGEGEGEGEGERDVKVVDVLLGTPSKATPIRVARVVRVSWLILRVAPIRVATIRVAQI